ncbi:uncharacterized protein A4U43_C01F2150 [Asparagus officinalis]|uniref:Uncharacterized protein n=1 Tax=Asparagus officinalis TaxID=4686 RepID=A0A5P1FQT0_ASPOF|nr:uncharacterized protein A4U43_C01F2150 [Asparagus officinalis]
MTATKVVLPRPPTWDLEDCDCILSSSSPTSPECRVLVANKRECTFLFCRPSDHEQQWTEYKYDLGCNNPIHCITAFDDDKFCGVTREGNFATIDCPPNPGVNILEPIIPKSKNGLQSTASAAIVFLLGCSGRSTASCSSPELGIKGNCLYYVEDDDDGCVYCFDLEEGFVSAHLRCLEGDLCGEATPVWMIPASESRD